MATAREQRKQQWRDKVENDALRDERRRHVLRVLKQEAAERSSEDLKFLEENKELADELTAALQSRKEKRKLKEHRMEEVEDSTEELQQKVILLAELMRGALAKGGVVVHTGAGISTAAGIPDFRGPNGVWTQQAKGRRVVMRRTYEEVQPTAAHMGLAALVAKGLVRHVITQNVDGLHTRSGIPPESLSHLHGSIYHERCSRCHATFLRSFDVTRPQGSFFRRHKTGRKCSLSVSHTEDVSHAAEVSDGKRLRTEERRKGVKSEGEENEANFVCGGDLVDTIVHFGEKIDLDELHKATEASKTAALSICFGTSLKVPPASKLPRLSESFAVVNLQWTSSDKKAKLKIHGRIEEVVIMLLQRLFIKVPRYDPSRDPLHEGQFLVQIHELAESGAKEDGKDNSLFTMSASHKPRAYRTRKISFPKPNFLG